MGGPGETVTNRPFGNINHEHRNQFGPHQEGQDPHVVRGWGVSLRIGPTVPLVKESRKDRAFLQFCPRGAQAKGTAGKGTNNDAAVLLTTVSLHPRVTPGPSHTVAAGRGRDAEREVLASGAVLTHHHCQPAGCSPLLLPGRPQTLHMAASGFWAL